MKLTPFAWLVSVFLRIVTPKQSSQKTFRLPDYQLPEGFVVTINGKPLVRNTDYIASDSSIITLVDGPLKICDPSPICLQALSKIKGSFNRDSDILVISEQNLDEALFFDTDGWLESIADRTIVFGNELLNVAIVRSGYGGQPF